MCDKCAELFENSHLRSITNRADEKSPLASLTDAINSLQTEIKKITSKPASTLAPNRWPVISETRATKRPRAYDSSAQSSSECQSGTKQRDQTVVSVPVSEKPASKFWLYLSRIKPDVSNEAICAMVKANMGLETDPEVVKLVAKGTDTSNMTFISFKVGLDPTLKSTALDPTTWPEGILFRQFDDYSTQKFRKPRFASPGLFPTTPVTPATS